MNKFKNIVSYDSLDSAVRELIDKAIEARHNAYAPYSRFKVGAALRTSPFGKVYTGCNVENASYGVAICAERVACVKAVSSGDLDIMEIAVAADQDDDKSSFVTPCGACRQFVAEFSRKSEVSVFLTGTEKGNVAVTSVQELLPFAFQL